MAKINIWLFGELGSVRPKRSDYGFESASREYKGKQKNIRLSQG